MKEIAAAHVMKLRYETRNLPVWLFQQVYIPKDELIKSEAKLLAEQLGLKTK